MTIGESKLYFVIYKLKVKPFDRLFVIWYSVHTYISALMNETRKDIKATGTLNPIMISGHMHTH